MTLDWRRAASRARGKINPAHAAEGAVAGLGVAVAIGVMEWLSLASHYPMAIIPFATSIALVVGSLTGPGAWAAAAAVGVAILAMYLTGTFHPPAGIDPLLVVSNGLPWSFLLVPVLAGALLLTAFAYLWHRWLRRRRWPQRWL
jgi:hypothetical protein